MPSLSRWSCAAGRTFSAKPVIVGYPADRSVVLSASYEARAFGVQSAMPMAVAARMCPSATVIEPRHKLYYEVSGADHGHLRLDH